MRDTLPGYDYLNLLRFFPRSIFYALCLGLLIACYLKYGLKRKTLFSNYFVLGIVYLTIISFLLNSGDLVSTFQGIFYFFSPLLVFQIVYNLPSKFLSLDKGINFYLGFLAINIPIALYLFFSYGLTSDFSNYNPYDVVSGFFAESHAFGIFILLCIALLIYRIKQTGDLKYKVFLAVSIFVEIVCYNEKLMVLLLVVLFFYFIFQFSGYFKVKVALILVTILMGVQVYTIIDNRIGIVSNYSFWNLPVFESYENVGSVFYENPQYFITGSGFGEYGTIMVHTKVDDGSFPQLAKEYNYVSIMRVVNPKALPSSVLASFASSIQIPLNTLTSLIVEVGVLITILLAFFYLVILKNLWLSKSLTKHIGILKKGLAIYLICIYLYANVAVFGSFDDFVTTIPFVTIAALIFKEENKKSIFIYYG